MARTKSSKRWLKEHFTDNYVKLARQNGYRSRAAYKLLEIQDKDKLIKSGMTVVDLGAAPGGWSEVAAKLVGSSGRLVALDILPMEPIAGVEFIQGDFTDEAVLTALLEKVPGHSVDLVISDMAPNITGMGSVDMPRAYYLCDLALDFARQILKPGGGFLVKLFQGEGFEVYNKELKASFSRVVMRKPKASRARSREVYALATGFKG
ncbi:MAG: 23S rRNA (uridine(2552)-2'-O)-methyltransferase RlmE [Gammaproteobacteria bacterium]|nr:23S rRNA (uridine(2552)-2'-O)-methyltransferase RlmE [Gammaproteobacteria bacterium]